MLWDTEDKVIRDPEANRQVRKCLCVKGDETAGTLERSRDMGHFIVKV